MKNTAYFFDHNEILVNEKINCCCKSVYIFVNAACFCVY